MATLDEVILSAQQKRGLARMRAGGWDGTSPWVLPQDHIAIGNSQYTVEDVLRGRGGQWAELISQLPPEYLALPALAPVDNNGNRVDQIGGNLHTGRAQGQAATWMDFNPFPVYHKNDLKESGLGKIMSYLPAIGAIAVTGAGLAGMLPGAGAAGGVATTAAPVASTSATGLTAGGGTGLTVGGGTGLATGGAAMGGGGLASGAGTAAAMGGAQGLQLGGGLGLTTGGGVGLTAPAGWAAFGAESLPEAFALGGAGAAAAAGGAGAAGAAGAAGGAAEAAGSGGFFSKLAGGFGMFARPIANLIGGWLADKYTDGPFDGYNIDPGRIDDYMRKAEDAIRMATERNEELFNYRFGKAKQLIDEESGYFNPDYFAQQGMARARNMNAAARKEGLRGVSGDAAANLERKYDLDAIRGMGTAYDSGYATGVQGRLQTMTTGLQFLPTDYPNYSRDYAALAGPYMDLERLKMDMARDNWEAKHRNAAGIGKWGGDALDWGKDIFGWAGNTIDKGIDTIGSWFD